MLILLQADAFNDINSRTKYFDQGFPFCSSGNLGNFWVGVSSTYYRYLPSLTSRVVLRNPGSTSISVVKFGPTYSSFRLGTHMPNFLPCSPILCVSTGRLSDASRSSKSASNHLPMLGADLVSSQ